MVRRVIVAGIAQLGEQQTEVLEVACSIHAPGMNLFALTLLPQHVLHIYDTLMFLFCSSASARSVERFRYQREG